MQPNRDVSCGRSTRLALLRSELPTRGVVHTTHCWTRSRKGLGFDSGGEAPGAQLTRALNLKSKAY